MDQALVEFVEVLRQNGLPTSTSEVADASRALAEIGLEDRDTVRAVLRSTLVKRLQDRVAFERAFEFYFKGQSRFLAKLDQTLFDEISAQGLLEGDELTMVLAMLHRLLPELPPIGQAAITSDAARLLGALRQAGLQLPFGKMESALESGFFARRLLSGAGIEQVSSGFEKTKRALKDAGLDAEKTQFVAQKLDAALRKVEAAAREEVERQAKARLKRASGSLAERPLATLSPNEIRKMQSAVRMLAEKLKARLQLKDRRKNRGTLNVRRTLRANLSHDAIPMRPMFRNKRPARPEVVVLCDVSDSVRNVSELMLLFTYTLQSLFSRVRSFVFVSEVGEVSQYFKASKPEEAVSSAITSKVISTYANSNYGRALRQFAREFLPGLTRRTTVIVIGDGRNNYNANEVGALKEIRQKCRRVLWICPEDRRAWGFGDSEMPAYEKAVDQAFVVQTLDDLTKIADRLIPR